MKGESKALKWLPSAVKCQCHVCTFPGFIRFNAYNFDSWTCNEQSQGLSVGKIAREMYKLKYFLPCSC